MTLGGKRYVRPPGASMGCLAAIRSATYTKIALAMTSVVGSWLSKITRRSVSEGVSEGTGEVVDEFVPGFDLVSGGRQSRSEASMGSAELTAML